MGTLYLLPTPLSPRGWDSLPQTAIETLARLDTFVVETTQTAEAWIGQARKRIRGGGMQDLSDLKLFSLKNEYDPRDLNAFLKPLQTDGEIGLLSDAGCPAIADPGNAAVALAHHLNARVVPLPGPSSILLALAASGFNGQQFCFHGYLPRQDSDRNRLLQQLETDSRRTGYTHLFIETPHRAQALFEALKTRLQPDTRVCVAAELTSPDEWIQSHTVRRWRETAVDLRKKTVMFLLNAQSS